MRFIDSSVDAMGVRSASSLFSDAVTSMLSICSVSVGMELSSTSATGLANARANIAIKLFMLQKYNTPAKNATPIYGGIGNFLLPKHHIYLLKYFKKQKKLPQRVLRERCLK